MIALADFLLEQKDALVELFATRVRATIASGHLGRSELLDHLPDLLTELEQAQRQNAWPVDRVMASRRTVQRAGVQPPRAGDLPALVHEHGLLLDCLFERMEEVNLRPSLRELRLLSACLSAPLAETIRSEAPASERGAPPTEAQLHEARQQVQHEARQDRAQQHEVQRHEDQREEAKERAASRDAIAAAVRASEERYRTLFESIDDGFCVIELLFDDQGEPRDYRFLEANAAFERQTGLSEVVGQTVRAMVPGHDAHWFAIYGQVALTGETVRFENHAVALGRWFEVYAGRVAAPELRQVAVVFKDITARKHAEQERERLLGELARSNESLDQFAYVASHDLKAPLRGIATLSHFIEEDLGDVLTDDAREQFGLLRGRVKRLEELINGILSYSIAGRSRTKPETVDVSALLTEAVELLSPPAHVSVVVGTAMPTLVVERVPLQQVFMNLIGNAVKHTQQPGAVIRVDVTDEGPNVHFTVADNGPGIAPEFHERIWGVFQKLETRDHVEGTGIGLSVVKKIVESRGGRTWVESTEGHGATFHVVWPRQPRDASLSAS